MTSKLFIILALSSEGFVFFGHFYLSVSLFFAILLAVFGHLLQKILLFWKSKSGNPVVLKKMCCVVFRVARLALLRPNSINLAFFKVVWHEKMVFGMYVIVWHFFGLF